MSAESELAAIKTRWISVPRTWEAYSALAAQAPHDVQALVRLAEERGVAIGALAAKLRDSEAENEGLRAALNLKIAPKLEADVPALGIGNDA